MTAGDKLDIGLIGLGAWARRAYVPILQELPDVTIKAVAARTEATRQRARELFGPATELYGDYSELLESSVDAVMIGLPPSLAGPASIAALKLGTHVFVEPPIDGASDPGGVLDLAEQGDVVFHADLELRYLPVVDALRGMVSEGRLGQLLLARVELANNWVEVEAQERPNVMGLGIWYVDMLDYLVEKEPERVQVFGSYPKFESVMELGTAVLEYPESSLGEWHVNLRGAERVIRLKVTGTEGEAEADLLTGTYRYLISGKGWRSAKADCTRPEHGFVGMRESVLGFLSAVRGESRSRSGPDVYRRLFNTLAAMSQSRDEKRPIQLHPG